MMPSTVRNMRFDPLKWLMLAAVFALTYLLCLRLLMNPASDLSIHTAWASECTFSDLTSFVHHGAHPLWHLFVTLLLIAGVPLYPASAIITALCKTAGVWLIHRLLTEGLKDTVKPQFITLITAVCALVSCLCVPFYNNTVYVGVGTPNTWHSPTQLIVMVWMLVCVPLTARCYDDFERSLLREGRDASVPWKQTIILGVLLFTSLLAKPTFMQAFLPACCLYFLWQWIRHPQNSKFFLQVLVCVLPAILFMIFQYLYYFGIIVPWQAGMEVQFSPVKCLNGLVRVGLIIAFPLSVLILTRRQKADTCFVITLLFMAVSVVEFLILDETGRRSSDGNFSWGMMGAALMLWVLCLIRFFKETGGFRFPKRTLPSWILLGWHLASGIYYVVYLFVSGAAL